MFLNLLRYVNILFAWRQLKLSVVIKKIGIKIFPISIQKKKQNYVLRGYNTLEINEGIFR